jgi:hypothetical protein
MLVKRWKFSLTRWIHSGNLMHNVVTVVNNTILFTHNLRKNVLSVLSTHT